MIVEQLLAIEAHKLPDQPAIRSVRTSFDGDYGSAEEFRKFAHTQCQLADDPKAASTATFERPEEVRILARVCDAYLAIGRDEFGFQQTRCRQSIVLGKTSKPATLNQASQLISDVIRILEVLEDILA